MIQTSCTDSILAQLVRHSTPTVANVINLLGVRGRLDGFTHLSIRAIDSVASPVVGYAVTATCRSSPGVASSGLMGTDALIERALTVPAPRVLVLQDLEHPPRSAVFGEVLATAFSRFAFVGIITDGAMRDIDEVKRLGMRCWCSGTMAGFAGGGYLETGTPVRIGGVEIHSGDILHADPNGIVQIPATVAPLVADLCAPYEAIEQRAIDAMKSEPLQSAGLKSILGTLRADTEMLRKRAQTMLAEADIGNLSHTSVTGEA